MVSYEIGVVYRRGSRHFIAVDSTTLLSLRGGSVTKIQPSVQHPQVRSISVEKLCESWEIDLDTFDLLLADYMTPPQDAIKTRPRGARRKKGDDDEYWRRHRTGRIARPKL